ncbi:ATP-binding protein [Fluviicola sp.]|uniref:sensor histidine kinase n=1 Tax=Fluviicola sp. TaxID=1917219 RepID=UPI0031CDEC77
MKKLNPFTIVLIGSSIVASALVLILLTVHFFYPIPAVAFISIVLFGSLATFTAFYYLFRGFIYNRLRILYRSIRKGKLVPEEKLYINMSKDIIGKAETDSQQWSDQRKSEITQLQEQDKFRREFIGNLAHELKTPVFSIQGYVLTLLEGGLEDEKVNRMFLERASKAIDRMTNILNDLDELTKLEVNDLKMDQRPFDLKELAKEVMDSLELRAQEKHIKLRFAKDYHKEIMVRADRGKIAQVLTNLISNSISYGNENGETQIRFYEVDELVSVEISDNGPGIEPHELPRLFERFYRVEKSRNRNEGGSGLGLSIVKHILDSHNQTISVRSTIGVGSTFTFSLDKFEGTSSTLVTSRGITIK